MAKQRKTREQKKITDVRNSNLISSSPITNQLGTATTYTFQSTSTTKPTQRASTVNYNYVLTDLRKTFFTTIAIIAGEIVLFFILKK